MKSEKVKNKVIEGARNIFGLYRAKPHAMQIGAAVILGVVVVGFFAFSRLDSNNVVEGATYTLRRGNLPITIIESGNLEAARAENIISEVEGQSRILEIVPEGTFVKKGDVLVKLDSTDIEEKLTQQEISFQSAQSQYAQAEANYKIQLNQSQSNIKAAELDVKFARLDLEKYLGSEAAGLLEAGTPLESIDFSKVLGGQALQRKRELESAINLAEAEEKRASNKAEWTRKLAEAGYVTRMELEADELDLKRKIVAREQAETALDIFLKYEFPRESEKLYSDYLESKRELERVRAKAESENLRAEASMLAAKATLKLQESRLEKLKEQLAKTIIRAPQDGMVIYASSVQASRRPGSPTGTLIEQGATIRYRQEIISLPDTSTMQVRVNVHESFIDKIKPGLQAFVTVDAFPNRKLKGEVTKVALLPDSPMRWLNPDIKVFPTEVRLSEKIAGLKPGMSAQVEIVLAQLNDVLSVPLQAVFNRDGQNVCWVVKGSKVFERPVEVGLTDDRFAEIRSGLKEGETVLLSPPKTFIAMRRKASKKEAPPKAQTPRPQEPREKKESAVPPGKAGAPAAGGRGMDRKAMKEYIDTLPPEKKKEFLDRLKSNREKVPD